MRAHGPSACARREPTRRSRIDAVREFGGGGRTHRVTLGRAWGDRRMHLGVYRTITEETTLETPRALLDLDSGLRTDGAHGRVTAELPERAGRAGVLTNLRGSRYPPPAHAHPHRWSDFLRHTGAHDRARRTTAQARRKGSSVQARHDARRFGVSDQARPGVAALQGRIRDALCAAQGRRDRRLLHEPALPRERGRVPPPRARGVRERATLRGRHRKLGERRAAARPRRRLTPTISTKSSVVASRGF